MKYIWKEENLTFRNKINLLILIMIVGGISGFIYEELFYRIDLGYFVKRGATFGPWIPIYAFGALLITLTYHYRKQPILVFLLSTILTGILEYMTGWILNALFQIRLWDYNKEILNFGNIGGYVCFRSVFLFGLSGLFLIYFVIPHLIKWIKKTNTLKQNYICLILIILFIADIILYNILK